MKIRVLPFAHARTELGFAEKSVECQAFETPRQILRRLAPHFDPGKSTRVAVNREYTDWDRPVGEATEMAVIPPVSGG